ncbi:unnamed protein product [marine sediment metagenome]|uniref:Uncharacterized protein n=1 Tax=marine sediment metagenome TaxID=412755 RepID=X1V0X0_9ZZZZ
MSEEQPVETPLREVGIDLVPPYPKPLTVGHRIQRVWSLLFGKRGEDLIPVHCNLAGAISVVPFPLTDMEYVESGELVEATPKVLAGFADLVIVKCYGLAGGFPHLAGGVGDGNFNYEGSIVLSGAVSIVVGSNAFPVEMVLYAHVNKIQVWGTYDLPDRLYTAYRYKRR